MNLPFPLLRPPSPDEARNNAEGNALRAEKTIVQEVKDTTRHALGAAFGVARLPLSLGLSAAEKTLNLAGNVWGFPSIVAYRAARYIDDTRDAVRKVTDPARWPIVGEAKTTQAA